MFIDPVDAKAWGEELKLYQTQRKLNLKFDSSTVPHIVTQKEVKEKQIEFHPILQVFQKETKEQNAKVTEDQRVQYIQEKKFEHDKKYMHEYNLVNLEPIHGISRPDELEKLKQNILPPNFNDYNIITNEKLRDDYFKNMRVIVEKKKYEKPVINRNKRDYHIINNQYLVDHETKANIDCQETQKMLEERYKNTHDYNYVTGQYYDPAKEQEFEAQRKIDQLNHGKDFTQRFPPSWKFRESVYLDQTKDVPEEIIMIDQINKNKKKRFELRHVLEKEYQDRDVENQNRKYERNKQRVKYENVLPKYEKEFDIITLEKPNIDHILKVMPPKPPLNTWEKVEVTRDNWQRGDDGEQQIRFVNEGRQEIVPQNLQAPPPDEYRPVKFNEDEVAFQLRGAPYQNEIGTRLPKIDQNRIESEPNQKRKSVGSQASSIKSQEQSKPASKPPSKPPSNDGRMSSSQQIPKPGSEPMRIKTGGFFAQKSS